MDERKTAASGYFNYKRRIKMKRREAIKTIAKTAVKEAIISSTGLISRELFELRDSPHNFYMTGSMGLASSIGLGIAVNIPGKKVVVMEGDGSLLMNLGALATMGYFNPKNLIHIVLDNNMYDSCSEESSISNTAKLDDVANVVGYNVVRRVVNKKELADALRESLRQNNGPVFILTKIEPGGYRDLPRPLKLDKITKRFKKFLLK